MRKTALTSSLIVVCSFLGIVTPGVATPIQIAQQTKQEFHGWDFYSSNISYLTSNSRTEARITLNVRNLNPHTASLSWTEVNYIRRVILVDAQGRSYRLSRFEERKQLETPFFFGETAMIQLSFFTPIGLYPRYLEIERSQGEPIRLPL